MNRKKIHKLLDLVLEIQERGKGVDGFPYVGIDFSNYGHRITLYACENGFSSGDFDLHERIETDAELDNAIILVGVLLEIAVDKAEEQYA